MDCVVATVSGYHGSDRLNLTKLISQTGANCVGALTKSTSHLVCWRYEGKKYILAKKFRTIVVNHRWIEDCIKAGQRIPEHPYMLQCGEDVGPITFQVQLADKKEIPSFQKNKALPCESSADKLSNESLIDLDCRTVHPSILIGSNLSAENLFHVAGPSRNGFAREKNKKVSRTLKEDCWSSDNSRCTAQELRHSKLIRAEKREGSSSHFSEHLVRHKRNICDYFPTASSEVPSQSGRRLVKGNKSKKTFPPRVSEPHDNAIVLDIDSVTTSDSVWGVHGSTSNDKFLQCGGSGLEAESSTVPAKNEDQVEDSMRPPSSVELSCVICWTDFSSTRGILQCGHRFCYSCIESWANHMASRGKVSACPLCKANFVSITKVDGVSSCDQKIYSQTMPDVRFGMDVPLPRVSGHPNLTPQMVCCRCYFREPVDSLICCDRCRIRFIHSYCLDPPRFPWMCIHCRHHISFY